MPPSFAVASAKKSATTDKAKAAASAAKASAANVKATTASQPQTRTVKHAAVNTMGATYGDFRHINGDSLFSPYYMAITFLPN